MKHLLEKTSRNWNKFRRALREYRNTPRFDGLSPAQWLFGHRQKTDAIAAPKAYARISDERLKQHLDRREKEHEKVKEQVDRSRYVEPFQFHSGDKVWVQDHKSKRWTVQATVVSARSKRSFIVNDGTRDFIRNKRFMRPRYD